MNIKYDELAKYLFSGREIEFSYAGKRYSITNCKGRWILFCDSDNNLLENICTFDERAILVDKIGSYKINGNSIHDIFNQEPNLITDIVIL